MKKIALALVGVVAISAVAHTAYAAGVTDVFNPGGWSQPCFYVSQTHEGETGFTCSASDYSAVSFAMDSDYRETILAPWRARWLRPHN